MVERKKASSRAPQALPEGNLSAAADVLFGGDSSPLVLRNGRKLEVQRGKVRHVGLLLDFFNEAIKALTKEQLIELVEAIETRSLMPTPTRKEVTDGQVREVLKSVDDLVSSAIARSGLLLTLLHQTNHLLPRLAAAMSNITEEEFSDLDLDEGMLVAYRIFSENYDFFSRNSSPLLQRFLVQLAQKMTSQGVETSTGAAG